MDKETREFRGRKVRTIKPSILKRVNVLTRAATFFSIERSHDAIFEETPIHRFVTAFNLYKSMEERERGGMYSKCTLVNLRDLDIVKILFR